MVFFKVFFFGFWNLIIESVICDDVFILKFGFIYYFVVLVWMDKLLWIGEVFESFF